MSEPAALDPLTLQARRLLVIAPHPDDESLGCGGLIASFARDGRQTHTVFVTDGGASHRNSVSWPRARLAAAREAEAAEALAILGAGDHPRSFLRLHDADMAKPGTPGHTAATHQLAQIVAAFSPDLVLLPWRRDPHRDHQDSWALADGVLRQLGYVGDRLEYAVWLDELGTPDQRPAPGEATRVTFDVAGVLAMKRAAVAAHLTQTTALITDDPEAFRLTPGTIARLTGPQEPYFRVMP